VVVGCAVWGIAVQPVNPRIARAAGMKAVINRDPTTHLSGLMNMVDAKEHTMGV
jgi:hypothetical protein